MPADPRPEINRLVTLGDSLSDRGTMAKRKLFGVIPMRKLSDLEKDKSPLDRFTNGFVWADHLVGMIANKFTIKKEIEKMRAAHGDSPADANERARDEADIGDEIISGHKGADLLDEPGTDDQLLREESKYNLSKNDNAILFKGIPFAECYTEGGSTASNFHGLHHIIDDATINPISLATRQIISNLDEKREQLFIADRIAKRTDKEKKETLIIEWSGANDLITANTNPTMVTVRNAVAARIENIKQLRAAGYQNIIVCNLPDLSLTPRFQRKSKKERSEIQKLTIKFNKLLASEIAKMSSPAYKEIYIFDTYAEFIELYYNPSKYELDPKKLKSPLKESSDFKVTGDIAPAKGYMFYDDVHPSAQVHALLAEKINSFVNDRFTFTEPKPLTVKGLLQYFAQQYIKKYDEDHAGLRAPIKFFETVFGKNRLNLKITNDENQNKDELKRIITLAQKSESEVGNRVLTVFKDINWIIDGDKKTFNKAIPELVIAAGQEHSLLHRR